MAKRLTGLRHIWQIARDLWEGPTPEVRDPWTSRHSMCAQSQV